MEIERQLGISGNVKTSEDVLWCRDLTSNTAWANRKNKWQYSNTKNIQEKLHGLNNSEFHVWSHGQKIRDYHVHVQWPSTATYMIHSLWLSLALLLAASGAQYPALPLIPNFCHETSSSNKKTWPWWILSKKASCNGNKGNPKKNQTRKRILPHKVQSMDSPGCRADNIQSYCARIESIQCHIFTWSKKSIQNWHSWCLTYPATALMRQNLKRFNNLSLSQKLKDNKSSKIYSSTITDLNVGSPL